MLRDAEKDDFFPCNRDVGGNGPSPWPPLNFLALNEVIMPGAAAAIIQTYGISLNVKATQMIST